MNEQWMPSNKKELMSEIKKEWKLLIDLAYSKSASHLKHKKNPNPLGATHPHN